MKSPENKKKWIIDPEAAAVVKDIFKIHYKFVGYLELPSLARQHNYREETRKGIAVEYVPNALPA